NEERTWPTRPMPESSTASSAGRSGRPRATSSSPTVVAWPRPCARSAAPSCTGSSARPDAPLRDALPRAATRRPRTGWSRASSSYRAVPGGTGSRDLLLRVLAGAAAAALDGDDAARVEDRTAPHAPRLGPVQGALAAFVDERAPGAQRLGLLEVRWALGEEEVGGFRVMAREHARGGIRGVRESRQ